METDWKPAVRRGAESGDVDRDAATLETTVGRFEVVELGEDSSVKTTMWSSVLRAVITLSCSHHSLSKISRSKLVRATSVAISSVTSVVGLSTRHPVSPANFQDWSLGIRGLEKQELSSLSPS